uniref:SGNH hydrolase-type esterase domain-containing protein n=2 Tax=Octactis speculum TaxID=3111310 RepID=A0A7S2HKX9_9STRA|mmetsp:Transcript_7374/g.9123  ORF Transcript_7374/g.9123 Transcript_7374/m.9123 type:complete len:349 (+) Transcript_7374:148-1194(+)|eukprot:CAMPEP_0185751594 /NCGR_PEP_ID=MMETSP1174-20130828/10366_1 /TAXON_ID=35687 /ORGANISM="Dictyocha speculum, Strain CCMP1381" /LENGTH=348 /DNA_ID=CAMNT_0028428633 /DNA_START=148 /DNA_END=1194 /DNA_ORIENTATION=+
MKYVPTVVIFARRMAKAGVLTAGVAAGQFAIFESTYQPLPDPKGATDGTEHSLSLTLKERLREVTEKLDDTKAIIRRVTTNLDGSLGKVPATVGDRCKRWVSMARDPNRLQDVSTKPEGGGDGKKTEPLRILFIGDSLVAGIGLQPGEPMLPQLTARVLAERLNSDISWRALNSIGGDIRMLRSNLVPKIDDYLHRCEEGGERKFDAVIIMCGLNDFKKFFVNGRTPSAFREDLEDLTRLLKARFGNDCRVVLPAIPVQWTTAFPEPMRSFVLQLSTLWDDEKRLFAAASRMHPGKIGAVDFISEPSIGEESRSSAMSSDGVHPNSKGYGIWADHIGTNLEGLLAKQR